MLPFLGTAAATTIYSNFGPGNDYLGNVSRSFGGFPMVGQAFTPSGNYQLTQIDLALVYFGGTNSVNVGLNADTGGLPGAVIATWSDPINLQAIGTTCCIVQTFTPSSTILLSSGTQYWIVVAAGASDTFAGWNLNNTADDGSVALNFGSGFSLDGPLRRSAFDVLGDSSVPEPTTLALTALGLALLVSRRASKSRHSNR